MRTNPSTRGTGAVRFDHRSFGYANGSPLALQNIDLHVKPGEVVALVTRSGSGKTTLVSLLARFYHPTNGQIYLDGVPLTDYALDNLRQQIALVNQNVILFNDTVAGNIAYGALAGTDM